MSSRLHWLTRWCPQKTKKEKKKGVYSSPGRLLSLCRKIQLTVIGACEYPSCHLSTFLHPNLGFIIFPEICFHFQNSAHSTIFGHSQKPICPCLEQIGKFENF